jgi:signal transduction histidine kinase/ActR/RegA family two-component response regulator
MALQALDAQAELLPYALALFGVALPIFAWACSFAPDRVWATATLLIFAINWATFYFVVDCFRKHPAYRGQVGLRARTQILGGLLWAGAVAQVAVLGLGAGPAREAIELVAVGGAVACIFFASPYLPTLLIVWPAASAPPILVLFLDSQTRPMGRLAMGAVALVLALSLIFNRLLRRQFTLAAERESLIADRAHSLARAENLARSKSDLIATLSDEIRNGLTGVAHVLKAAATAGTRSGPSREQMAAALTSAQDLIEALNATLDTEAAEAGRLSLDRSAFDAAKLLRDVVSAYRPMAVAKGLELTCHVDEMVESGAAMGDRARARQIVSNLVANAIKYTVRGRVEIRAEHLGEDRLRFEVADTGPGLTPMEIELAFEPFKRVARTGAGVSGAGLGLSLSRSLAQLMGGDIAVDSALSVGSCFRFDLPFDAQAALAPVSQAVTEAGLIASDSEAQTLRILTADDNALAVAMLRSVLEQLGHQVLHAHDGARALELAQICDVDLVMLSARMPGLDGPDVVRAIRALDLPVSRAPIITLIDGDAEEARACIQAGANTILRRPVTVGGVARALAKALREEPPGPPRVASRRTAVG